MGGKNINPDSEGTLEEIITGMADYEYVIEILTTPVHAGMPRGSGISDPTASKAMNLSGVIMGRINAIEEAKNDIPAEYMHGVWNNIQYRMPFPQDAARQTYSQYKSKYIYGVADRLGLLRNL